MLPIQRIALRRTESCIANNTGELFFGRAVRAARGTHHILVEHYRPDIVTTEAQSHLADFQSLRYPTGLHIQKVREIQTRNGENFQIFDRSCLVPVPSAERRVGWLEAPGDERCKSAGLFLQPVDRLKVV